MSRKQTLRPRVWVLLGLISPSSVLTAEQANPLANFVDRDTQEELTTLGSGKGCHDKLNENNVETLCETQTDNASTFDSEPILGLSSQIDIRPESCLSFFDDYLHTRRGLRIESALHTTPLFNHSQATVATFPVIDFISNDHAHVVKSKDLSSKIYTDESSEMPLFESIVADAEDINKRIFEPLDKLQTITATTNGKSTTLRLGDIKDLTLHITIQAGIATNHQIDQIALAKVELEKRWGFKLKIIEIP